MSSMGRSDFGMENICFVNMVGIGPSARNVEVHKSANIPGEETSARNVVEPLSANTAG